MLARFASPFPMANYPDGLEGSKSWIRDTERNRTSFKLVPVCWLPGHYSRFTLAQKENQATKCPKHQCHLVLSLLCSSLLNSIWWVKEDVGVAVTPGQGEAVTPPPAPCLQTAGRNEGHNSFSSCWKRYSLCFPELCTIAFSFTPLPIRCCFVIIFISWSPPTHQNLLPIATPHHASFVNSEQASLSLSPPSTEDTQ